jgi:DNA-binding NarL/FixJ family response regulator
MPGGDGLAAIEIAEQHHPDVMLLDVLLPKMDGLEATRVIASKHPQTRVIVLSLFMDDGTRVNALEAGAYRYLSKDNNRREILAAIRDGHQQLDPTDSS